MLVMDQPVVIFDLLNIDTKASTYYSTKSCCFRNSKVFLASMKAFQ